MIDGLVITNEDGSGSPGNRRLLFSSYDVGSRIVAGRAWHCANMMDRDRVLADGRL